MKRLTAVLIGIVFIALFYNAYTGYILFTEAHKLELSRTAQDYGHLYFHQYPRNKEAFKELDRRFFYVLADSNGKTLATHGTLPDDFDPEMQDNRTFESDLMSRTRLPDGSLFIVGIRNDSVQREVMQVLLRHSLVSAIPSGLLITITLGILYYLVTHRPIMRFMNEYYDHTLNLLTQDSLNRTKILHSMNDVLIHTDVKQKLNQILSLDSELAQKYSHFENFARKAAMESDKQSIYKLLWTETSSFMPILNVSFLEINHSANLLEVVFQYPGEVYESETVMLDPIHCTAYRYRQAVIHDCAPRECGFFECESSHHFAICIPVHAGGQIMGITRFDVDQDTIVKNDCLPEDWSIEQHLKLQELFVSPFVMYTGVIINNIDQTNRYKNQAISDSLTGLYNRRYLVEVFQHHIEIAQRKDTPVACCIIDIDDFKKFNDEYGHKTGDMVLRVIAKTIQKNARIGDIVGRFGGEEFLVILPDSTTEEAHQVAERIRTAVSSIVYGEDGLQNIPRITLSIGVAAFPIHGYSHYHITNSADKALYRAKKNGKNKTEVHISI